MLCRYEAMQSVCSVSSQDLLCCTAINNSRVLLSAVSRTYDAWCQLQTLYTAGQARAEAAERAAQAAATAAQAAATAAQAAEVAARAAEASRAAASAAQVACASNSTSNEWTSDNTISNDWAVQGG